MIKAESAMAAKGIIAIVGNSGVEGVGWVVPTAFVGATVDEALNAEGMYIIANTLQVTLLGVKVVRGVCVEAQTALKVPTPEI